MTAAELQDRRVIVRYAEATDPSEHSPVGHLAGETYSVKNIGSALEVHPDAEILGFEGGEQLTTAKARRMWNKERREREKAANPDAQVDETDEDEEPVTFSDFVNDPGTGLVMTEVPNDQELTSTEGVPAPPIVTKD